MTGHGLWASRFFPLPGHGRVRESSGVLRLDAGALTGGDSQSLYAGTYVIESQSLVLRLQARSRGVGGGLIFLGKGLIDREEKTIDAILTTLGSRQVTVMLRLSFICALPDRRPGESPAPAGRVIGTAT
ncbi:MAG: hypothetical protein NVSMB10_14420 [Steroidobacteraceae bacterium]